MVFSSVFFLFLYLPLVLLIYNIVPIRFRNSTLFVVSLIFYGWGEPVYISIMLFSTIVDYTLGYLVDKYRSNNAKAKLFVLLSVVINLSILGFFKYFDFIMINLASFTGLSIFKPLNIPLPIGISFYTFQSMSYTIDIYRNDAKKQQNIVSFGTYITLFPQLIAGPIVRYKDIAEDLTKRVRNVNLFADGIRLFIIGLGKKVLLANNIGMLWDKTITTPINNLSVTGAWLGLIAFGFQIYFDFSGYSDMAIGLGKMFGFNFPQNFNYPFIAKSITEFWRRWHITLGIWFREYVYFPLGGNRCSKIVNLRNLLVVWFLTGLWHGASWNYVLWGLYFGFILIIEKQYLLKVLKRSPNWLSHLYATTIVLISWSIFAIEDHQTMLSYLKTMFGLGNVQIINKMVFYLIANYLPILGVLVIASTPIPKNVANKIRQYNFARYLEIIFFAAILIASTAYLVDASYNPFLYFRF